MTLTGLHFLLTYRCLSECDHCFVWGSPQQQATFTLAGVREALQQARSLGTIEWIYFEGGEPALYHPLLAASVEMAAGLGFRVGVVTCPYWATDVDDALLWLRPLAPYLQDLTVSTDLFHFDEKISPQARNAIAAAERLGVPADTIVCELPVGSTAEPAQPAGEPVVGGADHVPRPRGPCPGAGGLRAAVAGVRRMPTRTPGESRPGAPRSTWLPPPVPGTDHGQPVPAASG